MYAIRSYYDLPIAKNTKCGYPETIDGGNASCLNARSSQYMAFLGSPS